MKKQLSALGKSLICAVIMLPMIAGIFLLNLGNGIRDNREPVSKVSSTSVEQEAFSGRETNYTEGTGFKEPASVGATLSEPTTWTDTWIDYYATIGMTTFAHFNINVNSDPLIGDYRLNAANSTNLSTRGQTATNPWIISTEREFAFWARYLSLVGNTTNYRDAYAAAPYFQLGADLDLAGKRWVPPHFVYATAESYTVSSTVYYNRIYFDGNGFTISNAYVKQSYNASSQLAYPSIFGRLTPKAQVKDLTITNAYISEGATVDSAAIISQNTANYDAVFVNINVENSVVRGSAGYGVNGIASYAAVIKDCSVSDTTFVYVPVLTTTTAYARGIGQASEFIGNTVARCSIEIVNHGYVAYAVGIGSLLVATAYAQEAPFGNRDYALENTFVFEGGFFDNTVEDSKMSVTVDSAPILSNGNSYNYGHAYGIGYSTANTQMSFVGNTLKNSLVSVKIDNNPATTECLAVGMLYVAFTANAQTKVIEMTDNTVLGSTISVVTQATTTSASGMFYVNSEYIDARIRRCYTENTDVISRNYKQSGSVVSYASGINIGFATIIEDCVVGSGNIEARNEKYYVYAYGIGSTLGKNTIYGPTGLASLDKPYGRHYFEAGHEGDYDYYIGDVPVTNITNCYNFSNITTTTTSNIYSAGIGMAEGFTNCINYGNVMGNFVGGIALGFDYTPNYVPTSANPNYSMYNMLRPLIITNCANYGNLIKAANNVTSVIGGMFATYWNSLNYEREWTSALGVTYNDDINGRHVEVTNCISAGKPYFYVVQQDYSYKLTDEFSEVAVGTMYYGAIFGRLLLNPYMFTDAYAYDQVALDDFLERIIISDNFYSEDACFDADVWGYSAGVREIGTTYNTGTVTEVTNLTEFRYVAGRPSTYYFANELGITYDALTIRDDYGYNNGTNAAIQRERLYNDVAKNWTNNVMFESFADVDTELNTAGWDTSSKVPQLTNASYPFQILAYDRSNAEQGYAPNVSIKRLNANQMAGSEAISFTINEFQNPQTGKSIEQWFLYNGPSSAAYNTYATVGLMRTNALPMFMLFADIIDTEFVINFESKADYVFTPVSSAVIGDIINLEVGYTNNTGTAMTYTAIIWSAENKLTGEYEEFYVQYFTENNNLPSANTEIFSYNLSLTDLFITKYAKGSLGSYYFEITATVAADAIYGIDIVLPAGEGNEIGVNWETFTSDDTVNVLEDSVITLTAFYDSAIYEFGQFVIDGVADCYVPVTNDIYSSVVSIQVVDEIYSITFELTPKKYDINIRTFMFTSGNLRVELDNSGLIESYGEALEQAAFVSASNVDLKVSDFYEDTSAQCYYQFVRWEYIDANGITVAVDTSALLISSFNPALIKRNLQTAGGDTTFVVVAIYQRQVQVVVDMYRPDYDNSVYNNLFEIFNGSISLGQFNSHGEVIIDENTLLRVEFSPDTRLEINEIDGVVATSRNDFASNALFIALNTFRTVDVTLKPRPATIKLYTQKAHESFGLEGGLITSVVAIGNLGSDLKAHLMAFDYNVSFTLNNAILGTDYRFISLGIKYPNSDTLYNFGLNSGNNYSYNLTINDNFFRDFVDINGNCQVWLFVANTYEVDLSASSFARTAGTYEYADGIGNSFALSFAGDPAGIQGIDDYKFVLDYGTIISYVYTQGQFSTFNDVIGISEAERTDSAVVITSPRQLSFVFLLNQYTLEIKQTGNGNAILNESYARTFELGSVITFAFEPNSAYSITDIKINGKTLTQLGAVQNGNTVTIDVTPEFIIAIGALTNPDVVLTADVSTQISPAILGGVGGGLAVLLIAFVVILLLVLRSRRINKQRIAAEAKAREYEQRFNIGGVIADLKKGD
ncbi:MAG: hypothetical protein LBN07_04625 [Christensenellaceae bacterium]|jgi:hypothetical protein|nr:hypothetical protein [Christensenellaceae bacterium]